MSLLSNKGRKVMGAMDNMKDKAKDMVGGSDKDKEIEQYAKDNGMTIEQAKEYFAKRNK